MDEKVKWHLDKGRIGVVSMPRIKRNAKHYDQNKRENKAYTPVFECEYEKIEKHSFRPKSDSIRPTSECNKMNRCM